MEELRVYWVTLGRHNSSGSHTRVSYRMIKAYQEGVPGNGKPFPDGAKMAKIHWNPKKMETFPTATVPGSQHDVDFMVKDSKL